MESKELRQLIAAKFVEKRSAYEGLINLVRGFCVDILVDMKEITNELPTLRAVVFLGIDELDDRTNTGLLDPIDAPVAKGFLDKVFFNTALGKKAEAWYTGIRVQALAEIEKNTPHTLQAGV